MDSASSPDNRPFIPQRSPLHSVRHLPPGASALGGETSSGDQYHSPGSRGLEPPRLSYGRRSSMSGAGGSIPRGPPHHPRYQQPSISSSSPARYRQPSISSSSPIRQRSASRPRRPSSTLASGSPRFSYVPTNPSLKRPPRDTSTTPYTSDEPIRHPPSSYRSRPPADTVRRARSGSRSGFRPAGLDDMVETRDFRRTFNPGGFSSDDALGAQTVHGGHRSGAVPGEGILDRPPTPHYESDIPQPRRRSRSRSRSRAGSRSRGRTQQRSQSRGRSRTRSGGRSRAGASEPVSKKSIEEAIVDTYGIDLVGANHAVAKTFVRPEQPLDLLDYPVIHNPRVSLHVSIMQPLYIGGGCVAGRLNVHIRGTKLDDVRLGRVSIDICGVEELSFSRKTMFMSIASELIDEDHAPPAAMLMATAEELKSTFWRVKPSRSFFPFRIDLPLNVGPGPFHSVRARIRYVIHGTILISLNGTKSLVRTSRDIRIISALDPETTLLPLQTPLVSTEEHALRWGGHKTLKVTAGLHRAVWVAGTAAYVDVNIINNTNRKITRIKCKLRRHILAYKNTVALTENQNAGHLRVPNWIERKTLSHSELNVGSRWKGVKGSQLDVITCEIEIPRNQLSVKMGRYFEVKYLVDVAVCTLGARPVKVQLPLTIIHMNSLDLPPPDLPTVTAAILARYGRLTARSHTPGRAFSAPREHVASQHSSTPPPFDLPPPLVPTRPALQPRKASLRFKEKTKEMERTPSRKDASVSFNLEFGSITEEEMMDGRRPTVPERRSSLGLRRAPSGERRRSRERSRERGRSRSRSRGRGNAAQGPVGRSTKEMLSELAGLMGQG